MHALTSFLAVCLFSITLFGETIDTLKQSRSRWLEQKSKGFYNVTTFSPVSFQGQLFTGMRSSCGYRFNPYLGAGGGIGLERFTSMPMYDDYSANLSLMPLYAEIRYTVLKGRTSPVIALNGGYKVLLNVPSTNMTSLTLPIYPGIAWNEYYEYDTYTAGGFFITVEAGVQVMVYKRLGIYMAVEYSLWSVSGDRHYWEYDYLYGSSGLDIKTYHYVEKTLAYTHVFGLRIGFVL
jgi:hypothetical protein